MHVVLDIDGLPRASAVGPVDEEGGEEPRAAAIASRAACDRGVEETPGSPSAETIGMAGDADAMAACEIGRGHGVARARIGDAQRPLASTGRNGASNARLDDRMIVIENRLPRRPSYIPKPELPFAAMPTAWLQPTAPPVERGGAGP